MEEKKELGVKSDIVDDRANHTKIPLQHSIQGTDIRRECLHGDQSSMTLRANRAAA
jgi:hypothetical protein